MAKTAFIQARIDENTKLKAQEILSALDISLSEAISAYLKQIILHRGIPFELKIPNKITAETLKKAEAKEDIREFSDVDELLQELRIVHEITSRFELL